MSKSVFFKKSNSVLYQTAHFFLSLYFKVFYKHKIYGLEHVIKGGAIIASNHASFYDPPLIGLSWPEEILFLARATLFHIPVLSFLFRKLNALPVKKANLDPALLKKLRQELEMGKKLLIFPEGTRSKDGKLRKIKTGAVMIARLTHCPIIPAYIHGTYEAWNRHHTFPRLGCKTACVFGSPIVWGNYNHLDKREADKAVAEKLEESIAKLKQWYENGAVGIPP